MEETWRWFGPSDPIGIGHVSQTGATGVVSALHDIAPGIPWFPPEIAERQRQIAQMPDGRATSLSWTVVESLPVSEDVKLQKGEWRAHVGAYCDSLRNLRSAGIEIVCYNFMPVLDWTRTDLAAPLPSGATCLRFDLVDLAIFDLQLLKRPGADEEYDEQTLDAAARRFRQLKDEDLKTLTGNIVCGLPGSSSAWTIDGLRERAADYAQISEDQLRKHFLDFLEQVAPCAESLGVRLCCHPDDPPMSLLGMPRIMSTEADFRRMVEAVDSPANGITLCSGSLGARPDNDLPGMMKRLGSKVHFLHLRNVKRDSDVIPTSFQEADHLNGDTDMVALILEVLDEERRRKADGRQDASIPFRPDHGHRLLGDHFEKTQPGYPAIGRLRGLSELRGVIAALSHRTVNDRVSGIGSQ